MTSACTPHNRTAIDTRTLHPDGSGRAGAATTFGTIAHAGGFGQVEIAADASSRQRASDELARSIRRHGSIVPRGASVPALARVPSVQRLARRMILGLLARIAVGRLTIIEDGEGGADGDGSAGAGGTHVFGSATSGLPDVTVQVHHPATYAAMLLRGSAGAGEAYIDGFWSSDDVGGVIELLVLNYSTLRAMDTRLSLLGAPLRRIRYWMQRNHRSGARRNIEAHYDLSNDFFRLFLDPTMMYSCAIFSTPGATLEEASIEKLDRICRKLELRPGDEVIEIGSGWGGFAIHAASHYGCRVTTTTISPSQFALAQERIEAAGLSDRVTLLLRDYRELEGTYDKLVSIEMIEAVGAEYLDTYFATCSRLLKPEGRALIQAIVIRDQYYEAARQRVDFLKKYIFPGSCLPSTARMLDAVRRVTDFHLFHLEDIGAHYVTTLVRWRENFWNRIDAVRDLGCDDRFIRMWDFYYGYCEGAFRARHTSNVQVLLHKPRCRQEPILPSINSSRPGRASNAARSDMERSGGQ